MQEGTPPTGCVQSHDSWRSCPAGNPDTNPEQQGAFGSAEVGAAPAPKKRAAAGGSQVRLPAAALVEPWFYCNKAIDNTARCMIGGCRLPLQGGKKKKQAV